MDFACLDRPAFESNIRFADLLILWINQDLRQFVLLCLLCVGAA